MNFKCGIIKHEIEKEIYMCMKLKSNLCKVEHFKYLFSFPFYEQFSSS